MTACYDVNHTEAGTSDNASIRNPLSFALFVKLNTLARQQIVQTSVMASSGASSAHSRALNVGLKPVHWSRPNGSQYGAKSRMRVWHIFQSGACN